MNTTEAFKMDLTRRVIKVFLASPNDLGEERKAAKEAVDEINKQLRDRLDYHVELVGWEDTPSQQGRPQATINRDLELCELFVGMLWKRWGTPPDKKRKYSSGFEEEFDLATKLSEKSTRPKISLFFKKVPEESLKDIGPQLEKVLEFKAKLTEEKSILFDGFGDVTEFSSKFRTLIMSYVLTLNKEQQEDTPLSRANQSTRNTTEACAQTEKSKVSFFTTEGSQFLLGLINKKSDNPKEMRPTGFEVARFRLLSCVVANPTNDNYFIGVHDQNLIYLHATVSDLSLAERRNLLESSLAIYQSENVPFWRWYAILQEQDPSHLALLTLVSSPNVRSNAILAMRTAIEKVPENEPLAHKPILTTWLGCSDASVRREALIYAENLGEEKDLPIIKKELEKNDPQTASLAIKAIISIQARYSKNKALNELNIIQSTSVPSDVVLNFFAKAAGLASDSVKRATKHSSIVVRLEAVRYLRKYGNLTQSEATALLLDSDTCVRLEALLFLLDNGKPYSIDEAKKLLVQPRNGGLGALLLVGGREDKKGEENLQKYKEAFLRKVSVGELEGIVEKDSTVFDFKRDSEFALFSRSFEKYKQKLRNAIDDRYKNEFTKAINKAEKAFGDPDNKSILEIKDLQDDLCKKFLQKAIETLCEKKEPVDLERVRKAVKDNIVHYSTSIVEYFRSNGEWADIDLIISLKEKPSANRLALLSFIPDKKEQEALSAQVIYKIGAAKPKDLLRIEMPFSLRSKVLMEFPDRAFSSLLDEEILALFRSEFVGVRKVAALKSVLALPKKRLDGLLNTYINADTYYYNVVHWLDLGVSLSKRRVREIIKSLNYYPE